MRATADTSVSKTMPATVEDGLEVLAPDDGASVATGELS
jgi:hypothetical protein